MVAPLANMVEALAKGAQKAATQPNCQQLAWLTTRYLP